MSLDKNNHLKIDDRDTQRIDPNECHVGDLYKPWYLIKNSHTGCPQDINEVCLVFNEKDLEVPTQNILGLSYLVRPRGSDKSKLLTPSLLESIKNYGQLSPIVCVQHYNQSPINELLEDPELKHIRCFEGHHRLIVCEELGLNIKARLYSLYNIKEPIDLLKEYDRDLTGDVWISNSNPEQQRPWFSKEVFSNLEKTTKYKHLMECFSFIKQLPIICQGGIDLGCAEGAYTLLTSKTLDLKMIGLDKEPGRIIRALLMRLQYEYYDKVDFKVGDWTTENELESSLVDKDFALCLSILHHMIDPQSFILLLKKRIKVALIEVRVRPTYTKETNHPTIIAYYAQEQYENMFKQFGNFKLITKEDDRYYYVLWQGE